MVNTGHPSRACKLCRARRIKCDETKPHCLKCRKSKRQCPGYRDPFEINLRDETQSTIRKAKAAAAAQSKADRSITSNSNSNNETETSADESPASSRRKVRKVGNSPRVSEASWDTNSPWSSPSTAVVSLQATSASASPLGFSYQSPPIFDFSTPPDPTTQPGLFDFDAVWSLPETSFSQPLMQQVASSLSFSFDGSTHGFGVPAWGSASASASASAAGGPREFHYGSPPVLPGLQTPLDEQASCYFLSNFVLSLQGNQTGQNPCLFGFILKILQLDDIKDTPFPMAFTAVSLAALAGRPNSRHLLPKSRIYYSTALFQLKEALKDKERAKHDASLASAILLSFYEGLACDDGTNLAGWSHHLDGAKALLRLRGKDVIKNSTPEGIEMFQLVRSMSIRQYMFGFVADPAPGEIEWWGQHMVTDRSGHVALVLNMQTTLIRAEADALLRDGGGPRTAERVGRARDLLRRARDMVTELGRWLETCHPTWPKLLSGWVDDVPDALLERSAAFPGAIYTFPNVWIAGKHLNTNASRIILSGVMVRCAQWIRDTGDGADADDADDADDDARTLADYAEAMRIGHEEVANVIASVPYFVDWSGDASTTPYFPCGSPTSPKAYSAITALYPLLCTGVSQFATARQKRWLCSRLSFMAETMGIKQGEIFANFIANPCQNLSA